MCLIKIWTVIFYAPGFPLQLLSINAFNQRNLTIDEPLALASGVILVLHISVLVENEFTVLVNFVVKSCVIHIQSKIKLFGTVLKKGSSRLRMLEPISV